MCFHSARTVPVQCPYSARTVPVRSARWELPYKVFPEQIKRSNGKGFKGFNVLLKIFFPFAHSGGVAYEFARKILTGTVYGHCTGIVRALYGHCTGTVKTQYIGHPSSFNVFDACLGSSPLRLSRPSASCQAIERCQFHHLPRAPI